MCWTRGTRSVETWRAKWNLRFYKSWPKTASLHISQMLDWSISVQEQCATQHSSQKQLITQIQKATLVLSSRPAATATEPTLGCQHWIRRNTKYDRISATNKRHTCSTNHPKTFCCNYRLCFRALCNDSCYSSHVKNSDLIDWLI